MFHSIIYSATTRKFFAALCLLLCTIAGNGKEFTIIIDAGHGGHDAGALGKVTTEKQLNLELSKKIGQELGKQKNTKVCYTRTTDNFVELYKRLQKGKEAGADLFIVVHCNSGAEKDPNRQRLSGTEIFILGEDNANANIDYVLKENNVIMLEDNYKEIYKNYDMSPEHYIYAQINQSKIMGKSRLAADAVLKELITTAGLANRGVKETSRLLLLNHTNMPMIYLEIDFICNPDRERFMSSEEGQAKIARAVANGVAAYRKAAVGYDGTTAKEPQTEPAPVNHPAVDSASTQQSKDNSTDSIVYKIQFLTSATRLAEGSAQLKGLKNVDFYRDGSSYKYTYGSYSSQNEAAADLRMVRKQFGDAFVIKTKGGRRIP